MTKEFFSFLFYEETNEKIKIQTKIPPQKSKTKQKDLTRKKSRSYWRKHFCCFDFWTKRWMIVVEDDLGMTKFPKSKVLRELFELKIKALLPTLTLGLSLVKVFCMLSCDWPRDQQGTSKIMIAALLMIFTVANLYFYFLHPKNTSYF